MFSLNLTSNADGQVQTFTTGRMALSAGDTVDLLPSNWADIQTATATVVVHHANGTMATFTMANGGMGLNLAAKEVVSFTQTVARFDKLSPTGLSASDRLGRRHHLGREGCGRRHGRDRDRLAHLQQPGVFPYPHHALRLPRPARSSHGRGDRRRHQVQPGLGDIAAFAGVPFTGKIATLNDLPSGDKASDFDVKINWGDGTTSAGTLQTTSAGKFDVRRFPHVGHHRHQVRRRHGNRERLRLRPGPHDQHHLEQELLRHRRAATTADPWLRTRRLRRHHRLGRQQEIHRHAHAPVRRHGHSLRQPLLCDRQQVVRHALHPDRRPVGQGYLHRRRQPRGGHGHWHDLQRHQW